MHPSPQPDAHTSPPSLSPRVKTPACNMCAFVTPCPLGTASRGMRHAALVSRLQPRQGQRWRRGRRRAVCQVFASYAESDSGCGRAALSGIKVMACDMDGTLLNSETRISERNSTTVLAMLSRTSTLFIPATGKSRRGALNAMGVVGEYLEARYGGGCPGVYLQGLQVYGIGGEIVYERVCEVELAEKVVEVAREFGVSLLAYSGDGILCEKRDEFVGLLPSYREPEAEEVGSWGEVIGTEGLNKFIMMADKGRIDEIRPEVARRVGARGSLTQAQGNMLEILPPGASKGYGVSKLLERLGVGAEDVLAIGDAENDLELLKMVGYSCAVGNALPEVKAVAKYTDLASNDEDGVAEAIERFILSRAD